MNSLFQGEGVSYRRPRSSLSVEIKKKNLDDVYTTLDWTGLAKPGARGRNGWHSFPLIERSESVAVVGLGCRFLILFLYLIFFFLCLQKFSVCTRRSLICQVYGRPKYLKVGTR